MIKTLSKKTVYTDPWMSVRQDKVLFPHGEEGAHAVVERKHGAFILIYNSRNDVLLLKQYRYPIEGLDWGLPGGGIDEKETAKQAAIREAKEEAGIDISEAEQIGWYYALRPLS